MEIQITQKQCGGTEFLARPHRLHLGAQNAAGVDQLHFILPEAWAGCSAALYLRRADGTLLAPVSLDGEGRVTVDRRLTGSTGGQWMLAAICGEDYTAYTRPGSYDTYAILPTDGGSSWPGCWKAPARPPPLPSAPPQARPAAPPTRPRPRPPPSVPRPAAPLRWKPQAVPRPLPPGPKHWPRRRAGW